MKNEELTTADHFFLKILEERLQKVRELFQLHPHLSGEFLDHTTNEYLNPLRHEAVAALYEHREEQATPPADVSEDAVPEGGETPRGDESVNVNLDGRSDKTPPQASSRRRPKLGNKALL